LKVLGAVIWLGLAVIKINWYIDEMHMSTPPREAPQDWGTPAYFHRTFLEILVLSVIALISVVPNRWLVFSPIAFCVSLLIALFPLCFVLVQNFSQPFNTVGIVFAPSNLVAMVFIFGPVPLSLTLSFWRQRRRETVAYV
jgi:hypothetical protein